MALSAHGRPRGQHALGMEGRMGFNDDGIGRAMAESYARETAEKAGRLAHSLEQRVTALEQEVTYLRSLLLPLDR